MIQHKPIKIDNTHGFEQLWNCGISNKHLDDIVINFLNKHLKHLVSSAIIEWPYYDGDYLSTYYIHYAKKFKNYPKYCYRIHFISKKDEYCGYTVLRPVVYGKKLGKTYLDPELFQESNVYILRGTHKVHLYGTEYKVKAFPWMMQETDISICAHVATWTVLRYYGNKYLQYSNPSMGEIVENVHEEWGRKTPSSGLTPIQVSDILTHYGFYPIIRGGNKKQITMLLNEIMAYIESGIPVIAMCNSTQHAFSIIGHGEIDYSKLDKEEYVNKLKEPDTNIILHSKLINSLYVMDDNQFPYRKMQKLLEPNCDLNYSMYEITYAIIPLYARMQLEYHEVYTRFIGLIQNGEMKWDGTQVVRIYITSSNYLKTFVKEANDINPVLKQVIIKMNMSRFVWCIDLSEKQEYKERKMSGKIIIDSTSGTRDNEPWILMHNKDQIKYYDVFDDSYYEINDITIKPYMEYIHNLDCIK